jgi:hypothetical protein
MKKRCVFCHKVLDEKGRCQNKECPDYIRTQILEEAEKDAANAYRQEIPIRAQK